MPVPHATPAITRTCLRDAAYERLRDWILDGTLAPEEPLRDEALAEALGMSRTPVREALQRLEDDGLVSTTATRRSYVSPLSLQQAREVFPMVAALEALAMRLALPHLDGAALAAMRATNERLAEALRAGDAGAALEADVALHGTIIAHSGNRELARVLDELKCTVRRIERAFWGAADRTASVRDHAELIAALGGRDLVAAERALARNWERGLRWINPEHAEPMAGR
jgi:DNA-binding GntR family transcriptional regulator